MRILITGSREFTDTDAIRGALQQVTAGVSPGTVTVVAGAARGADSLAAAVARDLGFTVEEHPALWRVDGVFNPKAGPERNRRMVALGADLCLAFPSTGAANVGTKHCIRVASEAGIPVREHWSTVSAAAPSRPVTPLVALPADLSFVTIDFETANTDKASIIQVGVSKVIGGQVRITHTKPVLPHPLHRNFAWANTRIHGLRPDYIAGALRWPERLQKIISFAGDLPLIAHNASVERGCIVRASEAEQVPVPDLTVLCSLKLARRRLPEFPKHGLSVLAEQFGITDFQHHDAGEDARVTALAVLEIARRAGVTSTAELFKDQVTAAGYTPLQSKKTA